MARTRTARIPSRRAARASFLARQARRDAVTLPLTMGVPTGAPVPADASVRMGADVLLPDPVEHRAAESRARRAQLAAAAADDALHCAPRDLARGRADGAASASSRDGLSTDRSRRGLQPRYRRATSRGAADTGSRSRVTGCTSHRGQSPRCAPAPSHMGADVPTAVGDYQRADHTPAPRPRSETWHARYVRAASTAFLLAWVRTLSAHPYRFPGSTVASASRASADAVASTDACRAPGSAMYLPGSGTAGRTARMPGSIAR